jgi:hypothetical protein
LVQEAQVVEEEVVLEIVLFHLKEVVYQEQLTQVEVGVVKEMKSNLVQEQADQV